MQDNMVANLPSGRRRDLLDEDEPPKHSHTMRNIVILAAVSFLVAAGVYGYWMYGPDLGRLNLLPAMQDQLTAAGHRIDAAEAAMQNWTSQRDAWDKHLNAVEAKVGGILQAARKQAEQTAARAQQHMQAELDQRTASLQSKIDRIQSAQQSTETRLSGFEDQLNQMQATNEREVERLREELRQSQDAANASATGLHQQIARVDQQSAQSANDLASIHRRADQQRIGFELGVNHVRELAPGINVDVTHTDVLQQRFDGSVWLMPDRRTIWIHGRGLQQPLAFYNEGDDRPRELVITRVTKYSVIGYVLTPSENAAAAPTSSTDLHAPASLALRQSDARN